MPKLRTPCERRGTCSHKTRNALIAVAIIGVFLTVTVASQPGVTVPLFGFVVGKEGWSIQVGAYGGSVAGKEYQIPAVVDTAKLPAYVLSAGSTSLEIDPDRVTKLDVDAKAYASSTTPSADNIRDGRIDGPQPNVIMELTRVWGVDKDGKATANGLPVSSYSWDDTTGSVKKTWDTYYMKFQAELKTATTYCNSQFLFNNPGDWLQDTRVGLNYEYQAVTAIFFVKVYTQSIYQNSSYQAKFGDAVVTGVQMKYNPSDITTSSFVYEDDPAKIYNYYDGNAAVDIYFDSAEGSNEYTILQLQGVMDPGILYRYDGNVNQGISRPANTRLIYEVMFSVSTSEPLVIGGRGGEPFSLYDYLVAVMTNPTDPMFWLIILGIGILVYLLIPKKKVGQVLQHHFHIGEKKDQRRRSKS